MEVVFMCQDRPDCVRVCVFTCSERQRKKHDCIIGKQVKRKSAIRHLRESFCETENNWSMHFLSKYYT